MSYVVVVILLCTCSMTYTDIIILLDLDMSQDSSDSLKNSTWQLSQSCLTLWKNLAMISSALVIELSESQCKISLNLSQYCIVKAEKTVDRDDSDNHLEFTRI